MEYNYKKQTVIFNPDTDEQPEIHVIGVGALGSWLTLLLVKLGFTNITVWDGDKVELHNLPNQLYGEESLYMWKVDALKQFILKHYPSRIRDMRFRSEMVTPRNVDKLKGVVFNCVDSMSARKMIYKLGYKRTDNIELLIEDRLSIHGGYIYTISKDTEEWNYEATLYDGEEAEVSECGVSQTIATAGFFISSIMADIMMSWLTRQPFMRKIETEMHSMISFTEAAKYI